MNPTQNIIDLQETIQTVGWKLYQNEVISIYKLADNYLHRAETPIEELRYWQGMCEGVQKTLNTPQSLIQMWEREVKKKEK
jgi:hypothetical protein